MGAAALVGDISNFRVYQPEAQRWLDSHLSGDITMDSLAQAKNPFRPKEFPATWASEWGQDDIGLWMAHEFKGVRHVFRWILPGTFEMGGSRYDWEKPVHKVQISQGFWLGETTVTQALWQAVMGENPSKFQGDDLPVDSVSWDDTKAFIDKLNATEPNLKLCLPTEAQWEYACRAGTQTEYFFGNDITHEQAHFSKDGYGDAKTTIAVKAKPANAWGLYQMHGNVYEWCQDWFQEDYYKQSPSHDPQGPSDPQKSRVLRGGSWLNDLPEDLRSAFRNGSTPDDRDGYSGFRLSRG